MSLLPKELAEVLTEPRPVSSAGALLFDIRYRQRNPREGRGLAREGVQDESVVEEYAEALLRAHRTLSATAYGWPALSRLPVRVYVAATNVCGSAYRAAGGALARLLLSNMGHEPSRVAARRRRRATAAHELTHLFQFELVCGRNWQWLNEASATAMERVVFPGSLDHFRFLPPWVAWPEETITDFPGYRSCQFIYYLIHEVARNVVSEAYRIGRDGPGLQPIEALAQAVEALAPVRFAAATGPDVFGSGYCIDAYFLADPNSALYNVNLHRRFGDRFVSESFVSYPVAGAASGDPIEHLGCRYYRFYPPDGADALAVTVNLPDGPARTCLRGTLIAALPDGHAGGRVTLQRSRGERSMSGRMGGFVKGALDHALLVVANCTWQAGYDEADQLTYSISADVE